MLVPLIFLVILLFYFQHWCKGEYDISDVCPAHDSLFADKKINQIFLRCRQRRAFFQTSVLQDTYTSAVTLKCLVFAHLHIQVVYLNNTMKAPLTHVFCPHYSFL